MWSIMRSVCVNECTCEAGKMMCVMQNKCKCVRSGLCDYSDVSTNLQTDTVQSTKIKRLPGYAVRL